MKKISFIILLSIIFTINAVSQTVNNNSNNILEEKNNSEKSINKKYDFNIAITQGISYNYYKTNFHYINFDLGIKYFKKHEIGFCIGDNDMIWYGGYYRINFEENINIGLKIANIDSRITYKVLNEVTFGRDLIITDNFYFRFQVFLSVTSKYPLGIKNESHLNKGGIILGINYLL